VKADRTTGDVAESTTEKTRGRQQEASRAIRYGLTECYFFETTPILWVVGLLERGVFSGRGEGPFY